MKRIFVKDMVYRKGRIVLTVISVAVLVLLILIIGGMMNGLKRQARDYVRSVNQQADSLTLSIPPEVATELAAKIADAWKSAMDRTFDNTIILCNSRARSSVRNLISRTMPRLSVIAYDEIVPGTNIEPVEVVSISETLELVAGQNQPVGV